MKASISFSEIQDYVLTRFNKPLSINYANDSSVVVDVPFTVFGFTKSIGITVSVLKIEGDDVYLSYSGPMGVDLLVPPAISFVKPRAAYADSYSFIRIFAFAGCTCKPAKAIFLFSRHNKFYLSLGNNHFFF